MVYTHAASSWTRRHFWTELCEICPNGMWGDADQKCKNWQKHNASQHAQLESRLWPRIHSKIWKLLRSQLCFGTRRGETTVPKKKKVYLKDPQEKGSRKGTRFLLGPLQRADIIPTVLSGSVCSTNFARYRYLLVLDLAPPTQEI